MAVNAPFAGLFNVPPQPGVLGPLPLDPSQGQMNGLLPMPPAPQPTMGILGVPGDPSSLFGAPFGGLQGIGGFQPESVFGGISSAAAQALLTQPLPVRNPTLGGLTLLNARSPIYPIGAFTGPGLTLPTPAGASGQAVFPGDTGPADFGQGVAAPPSAVHPPPAPTTAIGAGVLAAPMVQGGILGGFDPGHLATDITAYDGAAANDPAAAPSAPSALDHGVDAQVETDDGEQERPGEDEANGDIAGAEYEANMADARSVWKGVPVQTVARPPGAGMAGSDVQWSGALARALRIVGPGNFGQTPADGTADPAGTGFQAVLNGAKFSATPSGIPQWFSATPGQPSADKAFTLLTGEPPAYNENGMARGQLDLGSGMIADITGYRATSTEGPSIRFDIVQPIIFRGVGGREIPQPKDIINGKIRY